MSKLQRKWETDQDSFEVISKESFDTLYRNKQFTDGPLAVDPSKWEEEFGPYNPHRWAFGQTVDKQFVCCDVAAKAEKGGS